MKTTLLRDNSEESALVKELLRENDMGFREIHSSSERITPSLLVEGIPYSFRGYNQIKEYINSVKN